MILRRRCRSGANCFLYLDRVFTINPRDQSRAIQGLVEARLLPKAVHFVGSVQFIEDHPLQLLARPQSHV